MNRKSFSGVYNRMVLPFLFLVFGLQGPQLAEQQARLNQLQQEVQRLSSELGDIRTMLQKGLQPTCSSETRLQPGGLTITDGTTPVKANLLAIVSAPPDACLPAEIRLTATYFGPANAFVCSGTISIGQPMTVQNTLFEFRPYDLEVFAKWWDGATLKQQALLCHDFQGNELRNPTDYATSLHIYATVFPRNGGLSTSEIELRLPRLPRQ